MLYEDPTAKFIPFPIQTISQAKKKKINSIRMNFGMTQCTDSRIKLFLFQLVFSNLIITLKSTPCSLSHQILMRTYLHIAICQYTLGISIHYWSLWCQNLLSNGSTLYVLQIVRIRLIASSHRYCCTFKLFFTRHLRNTKAKKLNLIIYSEMAR